jgi:antitoxin PrlF
MDATVAERGQVVIPKAMRDQLGITPGMQLSFSVEDGKLVIRKKIDDAISRVRGRFKFEPGDDLDSWARDMRGRAPNDPIEPWEVLRDDMFIPESIRQDHAQRRATWLANQGTDVDVKVSAAMAAPRAPSKSSQTTAQNTAKKVKRG